MIDFEELKVDDDVKNILKSYRIDFVFQPIFDTENNIFAYEALMRPEGSNILDFIKSQSEENKLHSLEVATLFGATFAFLSRGYDKKLSINSFPSECLTVLESNAYRNCFGSMKDKLIIEILEYTDTDEFAWQTKEIQGRNYPGMGVAIDDFGAGQNGVKVIDFYKPDYVKLDRELIANINENRENQLIVEHYIEIFHEKGIKVLAEGVETQAEYELLLNQGVDLFQGFYLARPA